MYRKIGIIGLGYVGLTLAAALARKGYEVHGVDSSPAVRDALNQGRVHLFEPGIAEVFAESVGRSVFVGTELPADVEVAVIAVSTPVDGRTRQPDLTSVAAAADQVAQWCGPETLVVVRSTVPVGTSRRVVLPSLVAAWGRARLVMAPERTIQGQALRELVELPQVVGGLDADSRRAGIEFFGGLATQVVPVSSLEAAELVKLSNNCHTDLIYSFGNEVALIAERHGLDPLEVIGAANLDYPRPDLSRPGYVGGGCLSKDPYLMINSAGGEPGPFLVGAARRLNEYLPVHVANRVVELLRQIRGGTVGRRLAVLGWAYKGWPPTDDMRGTPIATMMPTFRAAGLTVAGHDPMVSDEVIHRYGGEPTSVDKAFGDADAVLVINDHPDYRSIQLDTLLAGGGPKPALVYDSWRILDEATITAAGIRYAGLGYLPMPRVDQAAPAQRRAADVNG
ncbi:UDP-N-acetyl-D-mannosaminuronic acid dehydrogenase [Micromonospora pisi]|uniref:UDP-N-acetyl-D-mannosaminuronic acid dehydrogenase n=1 Tax=Micromonospora pisi TaxID=589240 RepID=A0A495JT96_9ACTN|nr:nucleotide sugar dehydrogenase [Micromonospora pisi]RKR91299.1 UDP-N-acetyl-D-mannosaminuronic acid dehydrogenase [Micromonospora pisi]